MPRMTGTTIAEAWAGGRNNFNLIRLVAAWMVIYGHAWAITGTAGGDAIARLTHIKFAGAVAVDMFFVISGFLIAASLQRNTVRAYLVGRALRILPALVACVALTVFVLGPLVTTAADYWRNPETWRYLWVNSSLWSTTFDLPGVFQTHPYTAVNGSLWTLRIEARLYLALLVASLLGLLLPRRYTPLWALALVGAYTVVLWKHPLPENLISAAWCVAFFITGTAAWVNRDRIRLSPWLLLALVALAALGRGQPWFHLPYFALLAYGTLYLALKPRLPLIRRNDLSYGLYLYGWPAAQLVQGASPGGPLHNTAWATVLALAAAAASWFLVERPALRLKKRLVAPPPAASPANVTAG